MEIAAIHTYGLTRRFGALTAVEDVTLSVAPGQFFGFLGPNGAGKSTTIKMLTGLLEPSAGRVEVLGQPFSAGALDLKRQIGVVPEGMALMGRLTATEYLNFVGRMYGLDRKTTTLRTQELLDFMQLSNENKKLVTDFSHGMQKKLALAAAVIHGPKVLFLDEPFEGVDAIAAGMLKTMLTGMINRGATIFLTTHVLEIVERLCSHVAIISQGRLVANGSIEELRAGVASTLPGAAQEQRLTLEEIFLSIVGAGAGGGAGAGAGAVMAGLGAAGMGEPAPVHAINAINAGGVLGPLARAQYGALARLRWQMFTNGLRSNKGALELGARTFSFIVYTVMGLAVGAGAAVATYFLVSGNQWRFLPVEFWVLGFIWQMIPIMLASFQEQFDLGILLRFPVRFGSYVLLYMVFGLVDVSTILGGLFCAGIWFGVAAARPGLLLWISSTLVVFAVFNILLVRAVFAWIERWLAQRRTREILGAVFMVGLLSLQLMNPGIYQKRHSGRNGHQDQAEQLRAAKARYAPLLKNANAVQKWLPPGLAAQSLQQAVAQQPQAGLGSLGLLGLYVLLVGGILAIRLKAEFRGENLGVAPSRVVAVPGRNKAASNVGIHGIAALGSGGGQTIHGSGPVAAIMEKDVRSLLRTLPLLYAIGAPLILVLVFSTIFLKNGAVQSPVFPLALPICMVYAQLGFTQIFYNSLGTEGAGIQLYFLSPTPFRTVMLAKNILHSLLFAIVATVAGVLTSLRLGIPDVAVVAATGAWLLFALPCNLAAGNIFSIRMPYRVNPGRISRQRGSQANALLSLLVQLGFLAVGAAVFTLCWYLDRMWIAVPVFLVLAIVAVFVWRQVLGNADALANERRDVLIATLMKAT